MPVQYVCAVCSSEGVKLWRQYNLSAPLRCAHCVAMEVQKKKPAKKISSKPFDDEGFTVTEWGRSDQLGDFVPAVPVAKTDNFWGYSSVPDEDVKWWKALPTYPRASNG